MRIVTARGRWSFQFEHDQKMKLKARERMTSPCHKQAAMLTSNLGAKVTLPIEIFLTQIPDESSRNWQ